jgi:Baseplate J-like protein
MSCTGQANCSCGCCAGIAVLTPQGETNPPGQSAIAYRTGTWASFKESMLARLSSSDYPALAGLTTRADNDYSIALLDASALVLDILTFYQERLANESYLGTATQLYSLTQLSQLIGYQPSPGVSASVYLAFTLSASPGLPTSLTTGAITIPAGTTVQSVPGQGQIPQSFQTSADILGKPTWNALAVQTGNPWLPRPGDKSVYLDGTATQLQPGDAFLVVGNERVGHPANTHWDLRLVSSVSIDAVNVRTLVTWVEPLGATPAQISPKFYAFRQRAALFGYNAISPLLLPSGSGSTGATLEATLLPGSTSYMVATGSLGILDWTFGWDIVNQTWFAKEQLIDLDAIYGKIISNGWVALIRPDTDVTNTPSGAIALYEVLHVTTATRNDYAVSSKVTRLSVDSPDNLHRYYDHTRVTSALAQSEALPAAEQPLDHPLYGTLIDLEGVWDDLAGITAVAIVGKSQIVNVNAAGIAFTPFDGSGDVTLNVGDQLTIIQPPANVSPGQPIPSWLKSTTKITVVVADDQGRPGQVSTALSNFTLALAPSTAPVTQEFALVASVSPVPVSKTSPVPRTRITVASPLQNCYDRTATTVNANVGIATGGSPVTELLGSGNAQQPNQSFTLKQTPLTYVQAATPTGSQSSLQVNVNGAAWTEVNSLYDQASSAQVFDVMNLPNGAAVVGFGDGVEGATLPTGQSNIVANYRVGIGSAGNVGAGQITTLVDRPLGVSGVSNPMASTGGQDPQTVSGIRTNAPLSVLTLGRAVSIDDYQNLAASFAGIAQAFALWIPNGVNRGVFVTVAASDGQELGPGNLTLANLVAALQAYGNPNVLVQAQSFLETLFGLEAGIAYQRAYSSPSAQAAVQAAILAQLYATYSFPNRTFGQGVSGDEVAALIQAVPGVLAVNVTRITLGPTSKAGDLGSAGYSVATWQAWIGGKVNLKRPKSGSPTRICPAIPVASIGALPPPADILVLNPDPTAVVLGAMT